MNATTRRVRRPRSHLMADSDLNRAQRRRGQREGWVCEHGHPKKTDGTGTPVCPHRCGFEAQLDGSGANDQQETK